MRPEPMMNAPDPRLIVNRGLLPENLPPVFSTAGFWEAFSQHSDNYLVTRRKTGKLAPYNASKRGEQRRVFSIPHPLFYRDQALFFAKNWNVVLPILNGSQGSYSSPQAPPGRFRSVAIAPQTRLPLARLQTLSSSRFCLVTDVSRCFPSIYTHAIPWAIHTKSVSKLDRDEKSKTVVGNRLDFALRQAQDGQTVGIPVGPDISRLVSEIILSRVDSECFAGSYRRTPFIRHVDDYWIGGDSVDKCEDILRRLRDKLSEYQLDINELKTRIVPTTAVFGETWPLDLKQEIASTLGSYGINRRDPVSLFARVIEIARQNKDDGVIKYVIRQIDRNSQWGSDWKISQSFLAHCAIQFSHSVDYVCRVIIWRHRINQDVDRSLWRDVLLKVAGQAASLGHDGELLWCLWTIKELGYVIPANLTSRILTVAGPMVLAFSAHLATHDLIRDKSWLSTLDEMSVSEDQFNGRMWPLTLELYHLGANKKLKANLTLDGSAEHKIHSDRISIIKWDALPAVFQQDEEDVDDDIARPNHAIEDFASNYDDEDEEEIEEIPQAFDWDAFGPP